MKNNKGFTLIELLITLFILGLIMIAVGTFQRNVLVYNREAGDSLTTAQTARIILKTIVKELRGASPANNGSYAISQSATNTLSFYSDSDSDGLRERIRYFVSSSTLMRGSIKPIGSPSVYNSSNETFSTLAYNIVSATSTAIFEYYDSSYTGTSSPLTYPIDVTKVRLVKINLILDVDLYRDPPPVVYTSQVNLRNLKDNL